MGWVPPPLDYAVVDSLPPAERERAIKQQMALLRSAIGHNRSMAIDGVWWIVFVAVAIALASGICQAQQPAAGPLIDRIESRLESAKDSLDRSTAESRAWRDRFDRVDRFERDGKIGSRIGTFLDRVERIFWLVVVVFVVACIAVGLACAAYGIERVSAGAQAVLKVVQTFADTLRAWRGKA